MVRSRIRRRRRNPHSHAIRFMDGSFTFLGLLLLLILAPLPLGSIAPWAQALLTGGIFALLAAWALRPGNSSPSDSRLALILTVWALAVLFAFLQIIPLPPDAIAAISPSLHDLYRWALPGYGLDGSWRTLSTAPGATIQSGLLMGACGAAFFLAARHGRNRARALALAYTVIVGGLGEAMYGLVQVGGSLSRPASGTFVNRNHFAALLAMALCVGVGVLLARWQAGAGEREPRARLDRWARTSPLVVACLTILAGVTFSFSRMGLTAPVLMMVLFGIAWLFGPVPQRTRLIGAGVGAVALLLVGGGWPALQVMAERFQTLEDSYRVVAWEGTYALFQSSPIMGIGLGGLMDNLPRFLSAPIQEIFDHSHNEALEVLAEGGVVYAALIGMGFAVYFGTAVPMWIRRRDPLARGLGFGCLAAASSVLLHGLVEFPLRIPSNAVYLSVIMGLGWAVIHMPSRAPAEHARG